MKKKSYIKFHLLSFIALLNLPLTVDANFLSDMLNALLNNSSSNNNNQPIISDYSNSINANNNSNNANNNTDEYLTATAALNYIDQRIESIAQELRPHISDIAYLKSLIKNTVLQSANINNSPVYSQKQYKKDLIEQYIAGAILQYIEDKSYSYALQKTNNKVIARKISESMRNNALANISQNGVLNPAQLQKFVGSSLQKAVDDQLRLFDAPYQQNAPIYNSQPTAPPAYQPPSSYMPKPSAPPAYQPPSPYMPKPSAPPAYEPPPAYEAPPAYTPAEQEYPSIICCACLEKFTVVKRIFLRPCGHDMCTNCIFEWFFGAERKKSCPHCRRPVNLDRLAQDLT